MCQWDITGKNKMKKIALVILMALGFHSIATGQVCKISGSGDNVEVFSAVIEGNNMVLVTVGNDSQNISANVTVEVEVTYKSTSSQATVKATFAGKVIAKPNQESIIRIRIPEQKDGKIPYSVKVTGISGTKCQE